MKKIAVLGIDCQLGFMELQALVSELLGPLANHPEAVLVKERLMKMLGLALPVPGSHEDMLRFATLIKRLKKMIWKIVMTLDSHHVNQIFHPAFWRDAMGNMPGAFTMITADDIRSGKWVPRNASMELPEFKNQPYKNLREYAIWYAEQLAKAGRYILMVWPEHTLIGTCGHALHPAIAEATQEWERENFTTTKFEVKGDHWATENYGVFEAEVPLPWAPGTQMRTSSIKLVGEAEMILCGGEALSHCYMASVDQCAIKLGEEHLSKFYLLTDCTSPVPQSPGSPDFPKISKEWLKAKEKQGMHVTTSVEVMKMLGV